MLAARKTTYKIEVKQSVSVSERADLTFHVHFYFLPLPSLILFHHIIVILHSEKIIFLSILDIFSSLVVTF